MTAKLTKPPSLHPHRRTGKPWRFFGRSAHRRARSIAVVLWAVGAVLLIALSSCAKRSTDVSATPPQAGAVGVAINPKVAYRDAAGRPLWEAVAKRSTVSQNPSSIRLEGVKATLYTEGKPAWFCFAPILTAQRPSERVVFSGGVRIKSADGKQTFNARTVTWDAEKQTLYGEGDVTVTLENTKISGQKFEASTSDGSWRVMGESQVQFLR